MGHKNVLSAFEFGVRAIETPRFTGEFVKYGMKKIEIKIDKTTGINKEK